MQTHIIRESVVINTIVGDAEIAAQFYPDAEFLDADGFPGGIGWTWDGMQLHPPQVVETITPIADLRAAALAHINDEYTARTTVLEGDYPENEQKSWPVQIQEANAVLAGEDVPTPWIDAAATARGISRQELAGLIRAQDLAYRTYHGTLTGIRQALRDQIAAVPDDEHAAAALEAIQWPPDEPPSEPDTDPT